MHIPLRRCLSKHYFTAGEENDDTLKNESEIETVLDETISDVHVGQSAAQSQGELQFISLSACYIFSIL